MNKLYNIIRTNSKGFTIIEILVSLTISGLLAGGASEAISQLSRSSQATQTSSQLIYNVANANPANIPAVTLPSVNNKYVINASAGSGGSISPTGSSYVDWGNSQMYLIVPNNGYAVSSLTVDGSPITPGSTYTFSNVTANHTISCTFNQIKYTISASSNANGTISPSGNVSINYGSNQTFTITPNTGYSVSLMNVDGGAVAPNGSYSFTNVTANHSISCTFSQIQYTINASAGPGGTISPASAALVNYGGNQTFTITPNAGYSIMSVTVDGTPVTPGGNYTFTNVLANHAISCSFNQVFPSIFNDAIIALNGNIGLTVSSAEVQSDPASPAHGDMYATGNINITASNAVISGTAQATGSINTCGHVNINAKQAYFSPSTIFNLPDTSTYLAQANTGGTMGTLSITRSNINYSVGPKHITGNLNITGSNVVLQLTGTVWVDGSINITASGCQIQGPGTIVAGGNINITTGATQNQSSGTLPWIISNTGSITITTANATISAILYAPQGTVTFTGSTGSIYGSVIGKGVSFTSSNIGVTYPIALKNKGY